MATQTLTPSASHGGHTEVQPHGIWAGDNKSPFAASYGKLMMWFFLLSDAFTFTGLLIAYGTIRYYHDSWADPEKAFSSFPDIIPFMNTEGVNMPLVFVGLMTFILIASSVTMVLAVDAGHKRLREKCVFYLGLTIVGGAAFLGCQAWEWTHLIMHGNTLSGNHYGPTVFAQLFFTITGFHGGHVTSGVIILIILLYKVFKGHFDKPGRDYEMVEKVGLYWHFVDLVWVFVFTFFYLV